MEIVTHKVEDTVKIKGGEEDNAVYSRSAMEAALQAVSSGHVSDSVAANVFNVPLSILMYLSIKHKMKVTGSKPPQTGPEKGYSECDMRTAVGMVHNGYTAKEAAEFTGVPYRTLTAKVREARKSGVKSETVE